MNDERLDPKDPGDIKEYGLDWDDVLTGEGETTIGTSVWSVSDPIGLTVIAAAPRAPSIVGTFTIVWVSGGTAGQNYMLTNTITTGSAVPRTHEKSIIIPCRNL